MLRGKTRHALELQRLPGMNRIADRKLTRIDEPEDVAGICDLDSFAVAAEKAIRARSPELLPTRLSDSTMSFSKRPEHTRTNATRSRWRGSMFA